VQAAFSCLSYLNDLSVLFFCDLDTAFSEETSKLIPDPSLGPPMGQHRGIHRWPCFRPTFNSVHAALVGACLPFFFSVFPKTFSLHFFRRFPSFFENLALVHVRPGDERSITDAWVLAQGCCFGTVFGSSVALPLVLVISAI